MLHPPSVSTRLVGPGIVLIIAIALTTAVERTALFYHVDSWFADAIIGFTAPVMRFDDVLIVDADDASMEALATELGPWPDERSVFALAVEHLSALGAHAVVFDINFSDRREADDRFAEILAATPNVWLAAQGYGYARPDPTHERQLKALAWPVPESVPARHWPGFRLPDPALTGFGPPDVGVAVVGLEPDADGILRRVPLMHKSGKYYLPSLPLASLLETNAKPAVRVNGSMLQAGARSWPIDSDGNVFLRLPENLEGIEGISFYQLIRSATGPREAALEPSLIQGRTVFVGSRTSRLGDYAHVPGHGRMAGLDVLALAHANLKHNLVLAPRDRNWFVLFCFLGAITPLLLVNLRPVPEWLVPATFAAGALIVSAIHLGLLAFFSRQSDLLISLLLSAFCFLGQMVLRIRNLQEERRQFLLEKIAADEANALKSQFLSHMTHELRTPLSAIMGYSKLLADPYLDIRERAAQLDVIDKNCNHLLSLINNLLDQAKIDAGQMLLDFGDVSIKELVESVVHTLRPMADQKGLHVKCSISERVPAGIRADELRLRQIFVNLGGNAIKFTNEGGIVIDVDWIGGRLRVSVSDTGPGMSNEAMARIFEAFQQADVSIARSHGGTGLGLSISQNLARLMGGKIEVNSTYGQGSTFTLEIPAEAVELSERQVKQSGPGIGIEHIRGRVLIADDNEDMRDLLSRYLERSGVEVVLAVNGEEAVENAVSKKPGLIFMDMEMPVMGGLDAVRALRARGYSGGILALTAQSDGDQIEAMIHAGCDGYIEKPISRNRLHQIICQYLPGGEDVVRPAAESHFNFEDSESVKSLNEEGCASEQDR